MLIKETVRVAWQQDCCLATIHSDGTYRLRGLSDNATRKKRRQEEYPPTTHFANTQLWLKIFDSAWVEPMDINRASIKQVLALAFTTRTLLKGPSETRGAQWTH
jgi:hypothetical protein